MPTLADIVAGVDATVSPQEAALKALTANPGILAQLAKIGAGRVKSTDWGVPATAPSWSEAGARLSRNLADALPVPGYGLTGSTLQEMGPQVQAAAANLAQGIGPGITVFRGGGPGRYWSTEKSFAEEFGKVKSREINPKDILDLSKPQHRKLVSEKLGSEKLKEVLDSSLPENGLPFAGDARALDLLDEITSSLGFKFSKQSEGRGMPASIYEHISNAAGK